MHKYDPEIANQKNEKKKLHQNSRFGGAKPFSPGLLQAR
jgi:hypothetical protein